MICVSYLDCLSFCWPAGGDSVVDHVCSVFERCIACRNLDPNRPQELLVHDGECLLSLSVRVGQSVARDGRPLGRLVPPQYHFITPKASW